MANKVGKLIKDARIGAGYTQAELAGKIDGLSASDLSKAERGEKILPDKILKAIAKATGVTQKSLLEASAASSVTSKKTDTSAKTTSSSKTSMKVTSAEKKLVELYRAADTDTKRAAMNVLKGNDDTAGSIISSLIDGIADKIKGKNE